MSWWRKAGRSFGRNLVAGAARFLAEKGVEAAFNAFRKREREKTNKALESKMDEAFQDLNNKMKALHEDFKKLQEITAELEKNKEEEIARVLKSMLSMNLRQLSQRIQTVAEDVQKWPETTKDDLQLLRAYLEKNKGNKVVKIGRVLISKVKKTFQQLFRRTSPVAEDVQGWPDTTMDELQLRRAYLEKNKGNKEEDIARVLESRLKKNLQQLSQRIQSVAEDVQDCLKTTKDELQLLRAYLEKNKGSL